MASHPLEYSSVPSVNPTGGTGAHEQISASPAVFGAGVGEAIGTLGRGIEHAAETGIEAASTQAQLDAQTHAAEVHSWQSDQVTNAQEKFLSLRGKAALEALPQFKTDIDDLHKQARDQAGNQYTARLIDDQGRRLIDTSYKAAASHAANERKRWEEKTAQDSAQSYGNRAVLAATQSPVPNPADDVTVQHGLANSDNEVRNLFHGQGYDDPAIEAEVQKNRGRNVKSIVEQIAGADGSADNPAPGNVKRAFDFYKSQEDKIDAGSRVAISNFLRGPLNQIAGGRVADEAMGRPPVPPRPEVVADVPANFVAAVKNTEGYRSKAYWDVKQHTVGYGTRANSPDEVITPQEADARFNREFSKAAAIVDKVNPNLDAGTRAALASLTFNAGETWTNSGLGQAVRAGDMAKAKEIFLQYNKADGETNEGLALRRAREASWFGRGDISPTEASAPRANKGDVMLKILDNPDLQNRPQVQAAALARVNKIYQAWELQSVQDKASFDISVKNSTAEALSTGHVTQPLSHDQFITSYGVADGEKQWQDYQANVRLGSDIRSTANKSPDDLKALRDKYTPQPGETFVAQQHRQAVLDKAIASNEKAKQDDPADFLIRRTDFGAEAYKQFQTLMADKNATPEMKTAYAGMYAEKMRAEQLRLGISADKVGIVPSFYIDQLSAKINAPAVNGGSLATAQALQAEASLWGDKHWPDVYRQLAPALQPFARVVGSGVPLDVAQDLVNLNPLTLAHILKDENTEKASTIKTDVLNAFKPLAASMTATDGGIGVFNDFRGQAEKLAAKYVMDGMTSTQAAERAFAGLVGKKYEFQGTYRIPKDSGANRDLVALGTYAALSGLKPGDIAVPADDMGGLSPEYLARAPISSLRRDGKWVTATGPGMDEKGLFLSYNGHVQRGADGQPFFLSWSQLQDMGRKYGSDFSQPAAGHVDERAMAARRLYHLNLSERFPEATE